MAIMLGLETIDPIDCPMLFLYIIQFRLDSVFSPKLKVKLFGSDFNVLKDFCSVVSNKHVLSEVPPRVKRV